MDSFENDLHDMINFKVKVTKNRVKNQRKQSDPQKPCPGVSRGDLAPVIGATILRSALVLDARSPQLEPGHDSSGRNGLTHSSHVLTRNIIAQYEDVDPETFE
ncbi:hypothetical protein M9H77_02525 [Catharanthus roseus]|uniref:Uncharacterized protein n=1 Tax=Catharanthus roseus TaxID=4058 RepID=A0ACC0C959_CATRO|nr:hypothetical protein M9H77_02525 [Catharanthus roseus]